MINSGMRISFFAIYFVSAHISAEPLSVSEAPVLTDAIQVMNTDLIEIEPAFDEEGEISSELDQYDDQAETETHFFSFLDEPQEYITAKMESMARNLDEYFTDNRDYYVSSGSYLKIRQSVVLKERGIIQSPRSVSFKLRLPNTEKRLKIFFETPTEKQPYDISTQTEETPPKTALSEGEYILGIQGESGEKYGWKYKPTLGVNIDSKLDPFARFRLTRDYQFTKWNINWQETPYWYDSIGWGFDSYFELNKRISDPYLFRSATFAGWVYETDNFDLSHVFSLFHSLSDKKKMSYYAGAYGLSKPNIHTTHFLLGITYRQNIHRNYLFFEVEPQILYQKINRFHPEHSLTFRLEMVFQS